MPRIKNIPSPYRLLFYSSDCGVLKHIHVQRDKLIEMEGTGVKRVKSSVSPQPKHTTHFQIVEVIPDHLSQCLFPPANQRRSNTVAKYIGGATSHIQNLVNTQ
jgi:hypothetical protein